MKIGKKLAYIRELEKLTQSQFSLLTGLNLKMIGKYERNESDITYEKLTRITMHPRFKKYTALLMNDETNIPPVQEDEKVPTYSDYLELSPEDREQVDNFARFLIVQKRKRATGK